MLVENNKNRLVFICSFGRSGSTLLRNIFDLHWEISVAPELRFFDMALANFARYNNLSSQKDRSLFTGNVLGKFKKSKDPLWQEINCNYSELRKKLLELSDLKQIYFEIIQACGTKKNKKIFVDKIGTQFIENIIKIIPETIFINIVRDGREVCASAKKRGDWADNLINIAVSWQDSWAQYEYYKNKYDNGKNFYEVKYEDLISEPKDAIEKIFAFLRIKLPSDFFEKLDTLKANSSFKQDKNKTGIYVSRHFDEYFSLKEKDMINFLLRKDLIKLDYEAPLSKFYSGLKLIALAQRIKVKLHFWFKKKGIFWRYNKFSKFFK